MPRVLWRCSSRVRTYLKQGELAVPTGTNQSEGAYTAAPKHSATLNRGYAKAE